MIKKIIIHGRKDILTEFLLNALITCYNTSLTFLAYNLNGNSLDHFLIGHQIKLLSFKLFLINNWNTSLKLEDENKSVINILDYLN